MAAAEVAPFAKVGGLADVAGSLPFAIKKLDCDIRVIMPLYGLIDKKKYKLKKIYSNIEILTDKKIVKINIWFSLYKGIKIYFIDYKKYFGQKKVYFGNNSERFLFFSLSCLHILPIIKFKPNIIHCHDFHTALIPNLLKEASKYGGYMKDIRTLYTIHNLNYQGKSEIEILSTGNLTKNSLESLAKDAQDGDVNFMAQGIINSDLVNTVSPTYSKEIASSIYGAGLEKIIKQNSQKISGILNGIDVNFFNPAVDKNIKHKYSIKTINNKNKNKLFLQKLLSLPINKNIAVIGFISRLAWQKGIELITEDIIKNSNCQFIFLGTGQKKYESCLKKLARKYPDKVSAQIKFDIKLAQMIYAGSDIFLMPSRFEPCGLGQMISMRYGAVPIVRATGGLKDTVDKKVGFSFREFSAKELFLALNRALKIYYDQPKKWRSLQKNCMKRDFSWNKSAKEYLRLYKKLLRIKGD